jgi:hypothetical protein
LQVVLLSNGGGVADLGTDNVNGVNLGQLGFPRGPEILKQLLPRFQASLADDAPEVRSQVGVAIPVAVVDLHGPLGGKLERFFEEGTQLREDRNPALAFAFMVFRLGAGNAESVPFPIHVRPLQCQVFGQTTQPTEPR